jgi:hypothetical protein
MARSLRIEYENATDHWLASGNRREAIFIDDRDRTEFLRRLEIVCGRMGDPLRVSATGQTMILDITLIS